MEIWVPWPRGEQQGLAVTLYLFHKGIPYVSPKAPSVLMFVWETILATSFNSCVYFIFFSLQSLARMNKKDSWLFWWTLYLTVSKQCEVYNIFGHQCLGQGTIWLSMFLELKKQSVIFGFCFKIIAVQNFYHNSSNLSQHVHWLNLRERLFWKFWFGFYI